MSGRLADLVRWAVTALAAVYAVATGFQIATWTAPTTYAGTSAATALVTAVAGLTVLVAGGALWWMTPSSRVGPLTLTLGATWLAPVWVGWDDGNPVVRSIAMVVVPFVPVLVLHLVLSASRSARPSVWRWILVAGYAVTCIHSVSRALVRDPFLDVECWSNCSDNVFVAFPDPSLARALDQVWSVVGAGLLLLVGVLALTRLSRDRPGGRRWVLGTAAAFVVCSAGLALLSLARPEEPLETAFRTLFWLGAVSLTGLGLAVAARARAEWRRARAVARLADSLDAEPARGGIAKVLSAALGDPGLEVVYRLPGTGSLVDRDGRPAPETPGARAELPIMRDGEILAVVRHEADLLETANLESDIGAAVRLAVDNERLRAQLAAQLVELRESRLRVVDRADAERGRLERNLHDGAQQALLAVAYELGLAASEVRSAGDDALAADLTEARDEARQVIDELRRLARGIYPTVLADAGLAAALWSLADHSDVRIDVVHVPDQRTAAATERVAYLVADHGITQAVRAGVRSVAVGIRLDGEGPIRVTVEPFCGRPGPEILDRVSTIGGRVGVTDRALHAEVPCV